MPRKRWLAVPVTACAAALSALGLVAAGAQPAQVPGTLYGCVTSGRALAQVNDAAPRPCPSGAYPVQWAASVPAATPTPTPTPTATSTATATATPTPTGTGTSAACVTSALNGTCGPYSYSGIPMSNGYDTYVVNQSVNPQPGTTNTLTATDPGNWAVNATETDCGGCVQTFVQSSQLMNDWNGTGWGNGSQDTPLSSLTGLKVNYSETTPRDAGSVAEFAPDVWNSSYGNDVMFWADTQGRCNTGSYGGTVLGTANLDGQTWTVNRYGGAGAEIIFVLDSNPAVPDSCAQQTSGSINILAGYQWLVANGYMTGLGALTQLNTGWEICRANNAAFTMNSYSVTAAGR